MNINGDLYLKLLFVMFFQDPTPVLRVKEAAPSVPLDIIATSFRRLSAELAPTAPPVQLSVLSAQQATNVLAQQMQRPLSAWLGNTRVTVQARVPRVKLVTTARQTGWVGPFRVLLDTTRQHLVRRRVLSVHKVIT